MVNSLKSTLLILLLLLAQPVDSAVTDQQRGKAYKTLQENQHHAVSALEPGEREILLGLLTLKRGDTKQAITILSNRNLQGNPVAAMIRAEAYRRESVMAAIRAGNYAHAVNDDISRLKQAKLNAGIDEAEQMLERFVAAMEQPAVLVAAAPEAVAPVANHAPAVETAPPAEADEVVQREPDEAESLIDSINTAVEQWRKDWESRDSDAYLSHYHPDFSNAKYDYNSWVSYKRRINRNKTYINVAISNLKILKAPVIEAGREIVVVSFRQRYRSSNFSGNSNKQLYLIRNSADQMWQILSEGEVGSAPRKVRPVINEISEQTERTPDTTSGDKKKWAINIAAFDTLINAEQMATGIIIEGKQQPFVSTVPLNNREIHRVRIGMYESKHEAVNAMLQICPQLDVDDCWLENLRRD